jgi:hypothetical protein
MIKKIAGIAAVLLLILVIGISISKANTLASQVEAHGVQSLELNALDLNRFDVVNDVDSLSAHLNLRTLLVTSDVGQLTADGDLSNLVGLNTVRLVDSDLVGADLDLQPVGLHV